MVNQVLLVGAALLLLLCWQVVPRLIRSASHRTSRSQQMPSSSLEQPLEDEQLLARDVLRQQLVHHLRARHAALRRQEQEQEQGLKQWQRQRLLATLRTVQRQRFETSLHDLLPSASAPAQAPAPEPAPTSTDPRID